MQDALATRPDLHRVVVELTEHTPVHDLAALRRQCDELRARGALIALDDAGSGYSGLQQLAVLRPQVVKLDRALVSDADTDPVRVALAEMLGEFAGRIDAWLLAEGIETAAELAAFAQLGVPLAQGWLLGRPSPGFAPLAPEAIRLVRAQVARARLTDSVASLLRPVRQCSLGEDVPASRPSCCSARRASRPRCCSPTPGRRRSTPPRCPCGCTRTTDITETLQRALTRPPAQRFDPVLCTDPSGDVLGLLRIEDLASAAPAKAADPPRPRPLRRPVAPPDQRQGVHP